jgi:hypothetical protein
LGKCDEEEAFSLQLERGLGETPGIEYEFTHVESAGEGADVIDGLEDAAITVINRGADVQGGVDRDDWVADRSPPTSTPLQTFSPS